MFHVYRRKKELNHESFSKLIESSYNQVIEDTGKDGLFRLISQVAAVCNLVGDKEGQKKYMR